MKPRQRLLHGIAANVLALIARAGYQLAQVPILFIFWDAARVGTWMLLSTVPSYLVLSTLGFGGAGGNAITSAALERDLAKAQSIFKAIWLFITCSSLVVCLVFYFSVLNLLPYLHLTSISPRQLYPALAGLCLYVFVHVQFTGLELSFRYGSRYPVYLYLDTFAACTEPLVIYVILKYYSSFGALAFGLATLRFFFFAAGSVIALPQSRLLWRNWRIADISWQFGNLLPASTGFVLAGIVMSVNVQGYVLIIGWAFGTSLLATFVTMRMLVRFFDTIINFTYNLLAMEMSYILPCGDLKMVTQITISMSFLLGSLAVVFIIGMVTVGEAIHHLWTHGKAIFSYGLLAVLLIAVLMRSLAAAPSAILTSANRNFSSNSAFFVVSAFSIGGAYVTAIVTGNLVATAAWSVVAEIGQLVIVVTLFARLVGSSPRSLAVRFANFGEQGKRLNRLLVTYLGSRFRRQSTLISSDVMECQRFEDGP